MKRFKSFLARLITVTPFKVTLTFVSVFFMLSFINDVSTKGVPFVSMLDNKALDIKFQLRGPQKPSSKTIILAIDDKSFASLGQGPFDRAKVFAPMIDRLCAYGVKAAAMDVFWPEVERAMSSSMREKLRHLVREAKAESLFTNLIEGSAGDTAVRKAIEGCGGRLIMAYTLEPVPPEFTSEAEAKDYFSRVEKLIGANRIQFVNKSPAAILPKTPEETASDLFPNTDFQEYFFGATTNNAIMTPDGAAQAYMNNAAEGDDGNFRHYVPVMALAGQFMPSMAVKLAMRHFADPASKQEAQAYVHLPDVNAGKNFSVRLKAQDDFVSIPVDKAGKFIVNYYGPNHMFPHVSLADFLNNDETITYTPSQVLHVLNGGNPMEEPKPVTFLKKELFKDALVLVGSTAVGAHDIRPRPYAKDAYGVENHATALDNIVSQSFLERPNAETLLGLLAVLYILGLAYGWAVGRLGAKLGFGFAMVTIGGLLYFDQYFLFNKRGIVFSAHLQAMQFGLQYLAITVIKYIREENDKKFIRGAFDKFVSPAVIEQMLNDPTKLRIGGEKKELTILFSDVAGFTELSERIEAKVLTSFLNEYLGAMTDIVQANNGTLDKYIGDAVMAFWGAPIDNPKHAEMATKTAVEMQLKIVELNKMFKEKYGFEIEARVGVHTGEVSVGNFGSSKVFEYTVIGDSVNLASRLEGVNKYYGTSIMLSDATLQQLPQGMFVSREVDLIKVKGKHKPVKIHEVLPRAEGQKHPFEEFVKTFKEGLNQYYARRWDEAITRFEEVLKRSKKDKTSEEFIERCRYYKDNPPAEDWDGSWEMKSK